MSRRITPPITTHSSPPNSPKLSKIKSETRSKLTFGLPSSSSSSKEPEETSVISSLLIKNGNFIF